MNILLRHSATTGKLDKKIASSEVRRRHSSHLPLDESLRKRTVRDALSTYFAPDPFANRSNPLRSHPVRAFELLSSFDDEDKSVSTDAFAKLGINAALLNPRHEPQKVGKSRSEGGPRGSGAAKKRLSQQAAQDGSDGLRLSRTLPRTFRKKVTFDDIPREAMGGYSTDANFARQDQKTDQSVNSILNEDERSPRVAQYDSREFGSRSEYHHRQDFEHFVFKEFCPPTTDGTRRQIQPPIIDDSNEKNSSDNSNKGGYN